MKLNGLGQRNVVTEHHVQYTLGR